MKEAIIVLSVMFIAAVVWVMMYLYFPVSMFDTQAFGSTITTIAAGDTLSASRSVINTNFSNLNTDKLETTNIDTCAEVAALGSLETGTCGSLVLSVSPTLTGTATLANASTTNTSVSTGFKVGANGSDFAEMKMVSCSMLGMDVSHAATSTKPYDCAITGIAANDLVIAQFSTTSPNGGQTNIFWDIRSCHASSTGGFATCDIWNGTGADAFPSATAVGSSTTFFYADI